MATIGHPRKKASRGFAEVSYVKKHVRSALKKGLFPKNTTGKTEVVGHVSVKKGARYGSEERYIRSALGAQRILTFLSRGANVKVGGAFEQFGPVDQLRTRHDF